MNYLILLITPWNWTEVKEGIFVSLIFVLVPLLFHAEKRYRIREKESERRHDEQMKAHGKTHENLGIK